MNMLEQTILMLRSSERPAHELAAELGVSAKWIYKLKNDQWKDPGVKKIQKLHAILSAEKQAA